jgi:hypothetical protein
MRPLKSSLPGKRLIFGPCVLGSHLGFANATSLARMRHPRFSFAERSSLRSQFSSASPRGLLYCTCYGIFFSSGYLKRFFIVSILIAGLASKQGSINFGQKKRYRNRTSSLLAMCLYLGEAEQLPPPKPPFLCLQFCLCSCFYFCPTVSFMLPLKTLPQKKNVPQKMFFAPIFFGVPDSSCDIMSHKATLGATSSSKMRPHVAMRH